MRDIAAEILKAVGDVEFMLPPKGDEPDLDSFVSYLEKSDDPRAVCALGIMKVFRKGRA